MVARPFTESCSINFSYCRSTSDFQGDGRADDSTGMAIRNSSSTLRAAPTIPTQQESSTFLNTIAKRGESQPANAEPGRRAIHIIHVLPQNIFLPVLLHPDYVTI